ncbi:MAG: protein arginine kinase [Clostridia bacterium]|nr:protein arginine kinase [Clostridia bacterium]MBQ1375920.1 protein arginine kinase [Clostridia bacterium]MBQ1435676.1 protein arginine kinase [Clostridia bacterium]
MSRNWYKSTGDCSDIVISTRVRLARNLSHYPFPGRMDDAMQEALLSELRDVMEREKDTFGDDYTFIDMTQLSDNERLAMTEQHLISTEFETSPAKRALIVNGDQTVSIMVNEEDHVRIQCIMSGLAINECYDLASKIDDCLDRALGFAFSNQYGYLTKCPTNVGTGMRVSVMMNLTALFLSGKMSSTVQSLSKLGLTVRGMYGEGSLPYGNLYQISNQVTLGLSEHEILEKLHTIARQLVENERNTRSVRVAGRRDQIEDYCYRSLGMMKAARIMTSMETINLLNGVRYGVSTGLLPDIDFALLNEIMVRTQKANLMMQYENENMSEEERDAVRAEYIRAKLAKVEL